MPAWEANLLCQIVGQQIEQVLVALLVEQRLVDEFRVCVGLAGRGDGEVEVQCCAGVSWVLLYLNAKGEMLGGLTPVAPGLQTVVDVLVIFVLLDADDD